MTFQVLADKVALVTGAAGGMGEETARLFAEAGARVVIADFNEEQGRSVADAIQQSGGEAFFVKVDISDSQQVQAMIDQAVQRFGRLDVAVNNAAIAPDKLPVADFDEGYWDRLMAIDLKGTALTLKYELRQMIKQGGRGSIINIASTSAFRPQGGDVAYAAAKAAVVGMTKVAAIENGQHGIRVNAVAPGAIDTPMLRASLDAKGMTMEELTPKMSLLNRLGQGREIAQASLWLASDLSSYVTGVTLPVDAGYTNR
ncbi:MULTISPECIES: SDR family NAD(P)-dependent oxidoreductase [Streptomyces]|uniref:SDR family NAD(P)-dependent oxidoreductase n=1 Tax=Streptomyces pratisoli TaxID=3139917 RepID=A0ACC6QUV2_9ACTN|nr:SDR family NAD(P)-dependent oxidoreductase [Streptomyces sp. NBC_00259]